MPVWHEASLEAQQAGRIQMVGIVEEQHADRAGLFMQWKKMNWPILVDSLDLLDVSAVPITVLIDGDGIVQKVRARPDDLEAFLIECEENEPRSVTPRQQSTSVPNMRTLRVETEHNPSSEAWRDYGDALFLWADEAQLDEVIQAYIEALKLEPEDGVTHFHLGAALRRRFDSQQGKPDDFADAVKHWERALAIDPNQYIWRRRIQQYGPRLDKPYSFYDWIHEARETIAARGGTPKTLKVEPRGAEFANPSREFATSVDETRNPDPNGKVLRDDRFIAIQTSVVKATPGRRPSATITARVHVLLTPRKSAKAHWNNEAEPLEVWLNVPNGWSVSERRVVVDNPAGATSTEMRTVEFEVQGPASNESATISASAFYNVCEGVDGQCLYRRRDFEITID